MNDQIASLRQRTDVGSMRVARNEVARLLDLASDKPHSELVVMTQCATTAVVYDRVAALLAPTSLKEHMWQQFYQMARAYAIVASLMADQQDPLAMMDRLIREQEQEIISSALDAAKAGQSPGHLT